MPALPMKSTAPHIVFLMLFSVLQSPAVNAADIYVYPAKGQTDEQLANERYDCHVWAVQQTGFDPTKFSEPVPLRVVRVPLPANEARGATGKGAIIGAIAGAVIGGVTGHDSGGGAAIGSVLGGVTGSSIEQEGERQASARAERAASVKAEQQARARSERELRRTDYRRAISACLEARGYTVR